MTKRRQLTALAFAALAAIGGAACGGNDDGSVGEPSTSLVPNGEQQGSGSDGSVVENPPGATPGGSQSSENP